MLSCVLNVSEGRDAALLDHLAARAGAALIDVHRDPDHHRAVLTLAGDDAVCEAAARAVTEAAVAAIDVRAHAGVHPRLGSVDVVPFVPLLPGALPAELARAELGAACAARDRFCSWVAKDLAVPCFRYGPLEHGERSLVDLRQRAFGDLEPDAGPAQPHPRAGAICAGARRALVAYNLVLSTRDLALTRRLAAQLRSPEIRALGFAVAAGAQVSCNLVAPWAVGPREAFARLTDLAERAGVRIVATELVGLLARSLLEAIPQRDWARLDLATERTIEARLADRDGSGRGRVTTP
ncbi:MAG: hypothetical protein M0004_01305 [Actinomycetota bacterium]|nr:hypothetical protein [Actinomycetota bacterium]